MNVLVLSGSPKGRNSLTLQTMRFIARSFPDDNFQFFHVSTSWNCIEKHLPALKMALDKADILVNAYPVYSFYPPAQFMHAWEVLAPELKGRDLFFTQVTTSKKVLDTLAHGYFKRNADELKLKFIPGLYADQDDLPKAQGQADALAFWTAVRHAVRNQIYDTPAAVIPAPLLTGWPQTDEKVRKDGYDTLILTDCKPDDTVLQTMIREFQRNYAYPVRIFNIRDFRLRSGCMGCLKCALKGHCVYKDGFEELVKNCHEKADATVIACSIQNHGISPELKAYFDRTYFNGHRPPDGRKSVGYLVNGNLADEPEMAALLNGYTEFRHTCGCGIATNETGRENSIKMLAERLEYSLENQLLLPRNFIGEACMKMFRDLVFVLRGVLRVDHRYFQKNGLYDFPQDQTERIGESMRAGMLLSSPELERELGMTFLQAMVKEHQNVVDTLPPAPSEQP